MVAQNRALYARGVRPWSGAAQIAELVNELEVAVGVVATLLKFDIVIEMVRWGTSNAACMARRCDERSV